MTCHPPERFMSWLGTAKTLKFIIVIIIINLLINLKDNAFILFMALNGHFVLMYKKTNIYYHES